jgi:hypothetical protein
MLKQIAINTAPKTTPGTDNVNILTKNFRNVYHSQLKAELEDGYMVRIAKQEGKLVRLFWG